MKFTPAAVALLTGVGGCALAIAGVYVLAGLGWALLAGSLPLLAVSGVLTRGLMRG